MKQKKKKKKTVIDLTDLPNWANSENDVLDTLGEKK